MRVFAAEIEKALTLNVISGEPRGDYRVIDSESELGIIDCIGGIVQAAKELLKVPLANFSSGNIRLEGKTPS